MMKRIFHKYAPDWFELRMLAAALSGLLLAATFPPVGQDWIAFFALVPLLLTASKRPFAYGFICGLCFFAPLLYWLNIVMTHYGGLAPFFSVVAWLLLCTYLSLYVAASLWCAFWLQRYLRVLPVFSLPFIWVAFEYLRESLLTGFPWGLLGYAAIDMSVLRQVADLFGVYGLSFLFVLCNCSLALLVQKRRSRQAIIGLLCCLLLLAGALFYGREALLPKVKRPSLAIGLVQGDIEQQFKWDIKYRQKTLDRYRNLSLVAAKERPELLIWPEAATPFYMQDESSDRRQVLQVPLRTHSFLLFGGPAYQRHGDRSYSYYNSAFLLAPDGSFLGRSDKTHLVPFGEYVPLAKLLVFVNKLVTGVGDFSSGKAQTLALNGHKLGVLICYEAIFPDLARKYVLKGSDLLINLTNDAWFGRSSAPRQLLDMTRMRAIENRIWIARAANTGISALIAPDGQAFQETPIFEPRVVTGRVELGSHGSLYLQVGDLLPRLSLFLLCCGLLLSFWRHSRFSKRR